MRIGKFFSNCAKNKKIHGSGYRNRYTTAFTPRNRNRVTATVTVTATAFQNLVKDAMIDNMVIDWLDRGGRVCAAILK